MAVTEAKYTENYFFVKFQSKLIICQYQAWFNSYRLEQKHLYIFYMVLLILKRILFM